ncbi:protein of unknown function [Kyrpidia spormannii]|uniref:Uncharacterized protein n=1 Tax=Kyrpidia spormannii TaxID=2055160 RepID=A0ACA8ZA64_9BACL|nr:protein of unknown function [Kyrpidia spormannii]
MRQRLKGWTTDEPRELGGRPHPPARAWVGMGTEVVERGLLPGRGGGRGRGGTPGGSGGGGGGGAPQRF